MGNPGKTDRFAGVNSEGSPETGESKLKIWEAKTFGFVEAQGFVPQGATLLLAVSGGADSTALADFWARRAAVRYGCRLSAAHVNHRLRVSAEADQRFVADLCRRLNIPLFIKTLDPTLRLAGESVEMWARRERYRFFDKVAREIGADGILTAHHRDDLVETVFQRLGRGTGPGGLRGIPFRREGGITRPFLNRSRAEILEYLRLSGLTWREDESNADVGIERNWYRHRYLPALRRNVPRLDERMFAMAMSMQAIGLAGLEALEEEAALMGKDVQGRFFLPASVMGEKVESRDLESLRFWLSKLFLARDTGFAPPFIAKETLLEFCRQWINQSNQHGRLLVPLTSELALEREKNRIYCVDREFSNGKRRQNKPENPHGFVEQRFILDKDTGHFVWEWGNQRFTLDIRTYDRPPKLVFPKKTDNRAIFDANRFSCTLSIRTRRKGDLFSPFGVKSRTRKLKTFLNEEKIPIGMRDQTPIIVGGKTPAWVPGYGVSEFFKVDGDTTRILELALKCENH